MAYNHTETRQQFASCVMTFCQVLDQYKDVGWLISANRPTPVSSQQPSGLVLVELLVQHRKTGKLSFYFSLLLQKKLAVDSGGLPIEAWICVLLSMFQANDWPPCYRLFCVWKWHLRLKYSNRPVHTNNHFHRKEIQKEIKGSQRRSHFPPFWCLMWPLNEALHLYLALLPRYWLTGYVLLLKWLVKELIRVAVYLLHRPSFMLRTKNKTKILLLISLWC